MLMPKLKKVLTPDQGPVPVLITSPPVVALLAVLALAVNEIKPRLSLAACVTTNVDCTTPYVCPTTLTWVSIDM